ncbi:MAG: Maf family protein, partial [Pseudomonadota bacterium]
ASPRRQELLRQIGIDFTLLKVDVDEVRRPGETAAAFVERLALDKARAGHALLDAGDKTPVLGADTAVVIDDTIMGKPRDREHGIAMLQSLSGRIHQVMTAVALVGGHEVVRLSHSSVTFATLATADCEAYWDSGEPADKAGGYAIQGLAAAFVTHLDGSYSGVVGLPLNETVALLKEFGIKILQAID